MKTSYLLFIAVLLWGSTSAQSDSRVIAFSFFLTDTTTSPLDTGGYTYSSGRGGAIQAYVNDGYGLVADYPIPVAPHTAPITGVGGIVNSDSAWETNPSYTVAVTQFFDGANNIIHSSEKELALGVWNVLGSSSFTYDAGNHMITRFDTATSGGSVPALLNTYSYDAGFRLTSRVNQTFISGAWQNQYGDYYTYDDSGKLVLAVFKEWDNSTLSWVNQSAIQYSYSGSVLDTSRSYSYTGSVSVPEDYYIYYFSPANDTMITNVYNPGNDNYERITNTYGAGHNNTWYLIDVLDTNATRSRSVHTGWIYNSYNQVTRQLTYEQDASHTMALNSMYKFYYELYNPSFTPQIDLVNNSIIVFPSPTKNIITIKLDWNESKPFSIGIYDMSGRMVQQWNENAANSFAKTLPIPGLAAGNYIIKATNGVQEQTGRFVVGN